jgi:hypothetical protein
MDSKDLRNIASVYEAVYGGGKKKEEKKDTRLVVTAADKKANTKAYQNYKAGNKAYKAADHLGEGKAESPEAEEAKDKKDDDLAGAPNKKGKKVKRWWDDDGDGIGYEKGEVKKEQNELVSKEVKDLQKAAETGKGKYAAKADKLPGVGTGKKVKEEVELQEKQKDTPDQVAAVIDMYRSKKGTGEAVKDTEEGKKKAAKKERDYAAWERSKMRRDDPDWKHKKGSTTESVDDEYIGVVQQVKKAELEADLKRWGALEKSGKFTAEEIEALKEADLTEVYILDEIDDDLLQFVESSLGNLPEDQILDLMESGWHRRNPGKKHPLESGSTTTKRRPVSDAEKKSTDKSDRMYVAMRRVKDRQKGYSKDKSDAADRLHSTYTDRQSKRKAGASSKEAAAQSHGEFGGKGFNIKRGGRGSKGSHAPGTDRGTGNKARRRAGQEVKDKGFMKGRVGNDPKGYRK